MKKIDLGQIITILANLGVIAGIVFLGFELRQNNELMEAEALRAVQERSREFAIVLSQNPALAAALAKAEGDEPLTRAEEIQLYGLGLAVLRSGYFAYQEMMRGRGDFDVNVWRQIFHANPVDYGIAETWEIVKPQFPSDFVLWFEEQVVSRPL